LIDKLYNYLLERTADAGGATGEELLGLIFGGPGSDEGFGRGFLNGLLANDPRFELVADTGRWRTVDEHLFDQPLVEAPLVVVDLETTGQRPDQAGITEIGAIRLVGRREVGRYDRLVNPGRPIPPYVAKLTGINDQMVGGAPPLEDLLAEFLEFAAGAVIVAHNAAFDVALLDHASRRILGRPLGLPALCTFKLARQLLPGLERASLDGLAAHYELEKSTRHRALADAELTAAVLVRMLDELDGRGFDKVGDLLGAQEGGDAPRQLKIRVARSALERLPPRPGVFWLLGQGGDTLYVGRARDLREQVVALYLGTTHLSDRQLEMVSSTTDVGFRETASELETALVEANEIRTRRPLYNRADKHLPRSFYLKVSRRGPYPRLLVTSRISGDGGVYLGPIKGRAFADQAAEMLARLYRLRTCPGPLEPSTSVEPCELGRSGACSSPCNAAVDGESYRRQVRHLERDLAGDGGAVRTLAADACGDESGGRDGALLSRLLKLHRKYHWVVNHHNYLAALPTSSGRLLVLVILGGFCRALEEIETRDELEALVARVVEAHSRGKARVRPYEADVSTIMAHWLRRPIELEQCFITNLDSRDVAGSLEAVVDDVAVVLDSTN